MPPRNDDCRPPPGNRPPFFIFYFFFSSLPPVSFRNYLSTVFYILLFPRSQVLVRHDAGLPFLFRSPPLPSSPLFHGKAGPNSHHPFPSSLMPCVSHVLLHHSCLSLCIIVYSISHRYPLFSSFSSFSFFALSSFFTINYLQFCL